jgi:quinolinate synthase
VKKKKEKPLWEVENGREKRRRSSSGSTKERKKAAKRAKEEEVLSQNLLTKLSKIFRMKQFAESARRWSICSRMKAMMMKFVFWML